MKLFKFILLLILSFIFFNSNDLHANQVSKEDAYKAIVKIKTFRLDEYFLLSSSSQGSGAIISEDGIILTNHHVISRKDPLSSEELDTSFIICLTETTNKEPVCKYTADLISSNEDLDIALLKINTIDGYSEKEKFPYLPLNSDDNTSNNDQINILGYPSIGGETITITQGIISGQEEKYNKKWIKTDAVMSFGVSGGVAIDEAGGVIGVATRAHSDLVASLGYIINIISCNDWINNNLNKSPKTNNLRQRTVDLVKKMIDSKNSNEFIDLNLGFQITKPNDWIFSFEDETYLTIESSDNDGGYIEISQDIFPKEVNINSVEYIYNFTIYPFSDLFTFVRNEEATIGAKPARKTLISFEGQNQRVYLVPIENKMINIDYSYGEDGRDEEVVNSIINLINFINLDNHIKARNYFNEYPYMSLNLENNWSLLERNNSKFPLLIMKDSSDKIFSNISIVKIDYEIESFNNQEFLNYQKENINSGFRLFKNIFDINFSIINEDPNYRINDQFHNVVMIEVEGVSRDGGETNFIERNYYIKSGDYYISPSISYQGSNLDEYEKYINDFELMLNSLDLGLELAPKPSPAPDPDPEPTPEPTPTPEPIETPTSKTIITNQAMYNNLKGRILLQVESAGEAYYIHPNKTEKYFLGRPDDAFSVMREQGIGITNSDLAKIPVSLDYLSGPDTSGDGLPDDFKIALGLDVNSTDSDGDGYCDFTELLHGYDPLGPGRLNHDLNFAKAQAGRILLQVEENGEAWYVSPENNKRYFLGRPADAFSIMRNLGLGISNENLENLTK